MSRDRHPVTVRPDDTSGLVAWLQDIVRQARLMWRLFWDRRVPLWTKLIPTAVLAYLVSPVDLIMVPGLGQLDDLTALLVGAKLFIDMAPPEVVREHLRALGARIQEWRVVDEEDKPSVVVEGEYTLKGPRQSDGEK